MKCDLITEIRKIMGYPKNIKRKEGNNYVSTYC